jgi:hypothetical protein
VAAVSLLPERNEPPADVDAEPPTPPASELRRNKSKRRSTGERRSSERRKRSTPMSAEEYIRRRDEFQAIAIDLQRLIAPKMGDDLQTQLARYIFIK